MTTVPVMPEKGQVWTVRLTSLAPCPTPWKFRLIPDMNSVGNVAGRRHQTWSLPGPAPHVPSNASTHAFGFA